MENLISEDYEVVYDSSEFRIKFDVYSIMKSTDGSIVLYQTDDCDYVEGRENGLVRMSGSYCWRGVWEGRLYFTDDEYWGDELMELANLYEGIIEPMCQEFIKARDPDKLYD